MKKIRFNLLTALFMGSVLIGFIGCTSKETGNSKEMQAKVDSMQNLLKEMANGSPALEKNLTTFDTLDFVIFSGQQWVRFHESHADDIIVNWPDGHHTNGLPRHVEDLKTMFVYAPDTRIKVHPIRFGNNTGEWTCVTGVMEGTFTKPMPVGNGKFIQPTGKSFKLPMCTIGHWKNGLMIEESLFWDNQTYMTQMGLGK
ncbi:ester cyclase [Flavihumibacter profundi]|uniref:ester cyclase n=1 Tax=Flavihumibacter profundi TaxID=2716883 RepID=UPI001CC3A612|nr:ester cyclase [Flavihumibacter profundi]MBZ5857844.1 ester cyclase [Flavihumibacter profundi]